MLFAYRQTDGKLHRIGPAETLDDAIWIDLYRPQPEQVARVRALGIEVPTLEDMEEIEISNRLYNEGEVHYMTVVLPGLTPDGAQVSGPVTFILAQGRLVTVRHHAPRPFETYPDRADKVGPGCTRPEKIFLGLIEEIIGRLADLLENAGRALDGVSGEVFVGTARALRQEQLQAVLEKVGRQGDALARVRLALLTLGRMLGFYVLSLDGSVGEGPGAEGKAGGAKVREAQLRSNGLRPVVKGLTRDIQSLEVHADFLNGRVALAVDATLGMINLAQNATVRILSVVAALFLPPTLIASIYGMNFAHMPELETVWGYPVSLGLMVVSAAVTYLFLKWKRWL